MSKDTSGPAFPMVSTAGFVRHGMTLRQWYKGQVVAAVFRELAGDGYLFEKAGDDESIKHLHGAIANVSGLLADALLAEDES